MSENKPEQKTDIKKESVKSMVDEHEQAKQDFVTTINQVVSVSNTLITDLQKLEKYVSSSFFKTNVMVLITRIEKNVQAIVEKSPETEIIMEKTMKTIQNPEARKKVQELLKELES